ncbi:MAG: hypothetical protein ACTHN5_00780 [Phycisphaerae bacterium]
MSLYVRCLSIAVCVTALSGAAARAEQVDNPEYASWAKFKPGTTVTFSEVTDRNTPKGEVKSEMIITKKLVEVKPDVVELELTEKAGAGHGGMIIVNPTVRKMKVRAKTEKEKEGVAPNGIVEVKDLKEGKEKVDVMGKSIDATTQEKTMVSTKSTLVSGPMGNIRFVLNEHIKSWFSSDVPGRMVKCVMEVEGPPKTTTTATLTDVNIAK